MVTAFVITLHHAQRVFASTDNRLKAGLNCMRSENEVTNAINKYSDTVKRICFVHLKNHADTEDIFQNVFLKYALSPIQFESYEHEKAWIIRVTINACKDLLKSFFRKNTVPLEKNMELKTEILPEHRDIIEAVLKLPEKYRNVIYLHYYEGYTAPQISEILNKNTNTIYTLISRAKEMLKKEIGGDYIG